MSAISRAGWVAVLAVAGLGGCQGPDGAFVAAARERARPLTGAPGELDALVARMGQADVVVLGGATHGTHEFAQARAELTRRLVEEQGFSAVVVEGDEVSAQRVDDALRGVGLHAPDDPDPLGDFDHEARWMWRNAETRGLVEWLRTRNAAARHEGAPGTQVGFYGLDVYAPRASADAAVDYLYRVDPDAGRDAHAAYRCLSSPDLDCERAVQQVADALEAQEARYAAEQGAGGDEAWFHAVREARAAWAGVHYKLLADAGGTAARAFREAFLADGLEALLAHLGRTGVPARVVVWAHDAHAGDARATAQARRGEVSLGQRLRERHPGRTFLLGQDTYEGEVVGLGAAGGPAVYPLGPPRPRSQEALLHELGQAAFWLPLEDAPDALAIPRERRTLGERYQPDAADETFYTAAKLSAQFDALLFFDRTTALAPLDAQ